MDSGGVGILLSSGCSTVLTEIGCACVCTICTHIQPPPLFPVYVCVYSERMDKVVESIRERVDSEELSDLLVVVHCFYSQQRGPTSVLFLLSHVCALLIAVVILCQYALWEQSCMHVSAVL